MATRVGVDVGGTFTDVIFYDESSGEIRVGKEPTTPEGPEAGVVSAVGSAVPDDRKSATEYFLHGTTVGLNALLTRSGATLGLLATDGFRDVLEIRRGDRPDIYDLYWHFPEPLVPRHLRLPVRERTLSDGTIELEVGEEDVQAAVKAFREHDVAAVAVAFINAYLNPANELRAEQLLRDAGFEGDISLSHRVSGEYREYERTSTTVLDAYVRGKMDRYLSRLDGLLRDRGIDGHRLVMRSGGGAISFDKARDRPFETIMSGPVAGAEGAAELARALKLGDVITADVGGTSFDTALITGGRPRLMYEGSIVGMPVQTPWVDVRSIGAGGGSVAYIDTGGLLRVGPRSAGAVPGPACYGRGGTEPTVTDAAFVLGMLGEGRLASGVVLDRDAAGAALETLTAGLDMSVEQVARGIITIANANKADAIRGITVEQGIDPRSGTLMPFGGAGPLFGTMLARELEMRDILVPPYAGNFSAWGLLGADLTLTTARTRILRLGEGTVAEINGILTELFQELEQRQQRSQTNGTGSARELDVGLDMRYIGQEHTITTLVPVDESGRITVSEDGITQAFTDVYSRTFAHTMELPAEVVAVRATLRNPLPERTLGYRTASGDSLVDAETVEAFSFTADEWLTFKVVDRTKLAIDDVVEGPAIVVEETATTYLDREFVARVGEGNAMFITDTQEA